MLTRRQERANVQKHANFHSQTNTRKYTHNTWTVTVNRRITIRVSRNRQNSQPLQTFAQFPNWNCIISHETLASFREPFPDLPKGKKQQERRKETLRVRYRSFHMRNLPLYQLNKTLRLIQPQHPQTTVELTGTMEHHDTMWLLLAWRSEFTHHYS